MPAHYLAILSGLSFRAVPLPAGDFVAGRAPEVDLRLDHPEISRSHCRFSSEEGTWQVQDLGSQWGIRVNGQPITGATAIQPGDQIALGPVILLFAAGDPPERPPEVALIPLTSEAHVEAPERIGLSDRLTIGRGEGSDLVLADRAVSREHAVIERIPGGFKITDAHSTAGSFVNGRRFDEHELTIGDRIQIGPFYFQFDGVALNGVSAISGGAILARDVTRQAGSVLVLDRVSLQIESCQFTGILGPSGAGKSSLLAVLSGMQRPDAGVVLADGVEISAGKEARQFGFVPQDDLVHPELTVDQALGFAARLRLPRGTPREAISRLVRQTVVKLGLAERATIPIGRLSGGQRKRVSVGVELLARPSILFLDEPSSGLDPATEFKLMELLRDLADTGCTVVCTTHVMENAYLMDQLLVMARGRLVFSGSPQSTRETFGVDRLSALYDQLEQGAAPDPVAAPPLPAPGRFSPAPGRQRRALALPILLARQRKILEADRKNFVILLGQPLVIAALVAWVSNDVSLQLFFAYIAALWFGCSNASQEIVKEIAIYRRERVVGLGRFSYLASKFLFLSAITILQAAVLYGALQILEGGIAGSFLWQGLALAFTGVAAVGLGLAISALARSIMQAVLVIPLILIPMILFSGYTVPAHEMKPPVAAVSAWMPTFAAQRVMDVSLLWQQRIARETLSDHWTSFRNLNREGNLKTGQIFNHFGAGLSGLLTLSLWSVATFLIGLLGLRTREKG